MRGDEDRRKRRRHRRLTAIGIFLGLALGLAWFFEMQATTTVFIVRFAEVTDMDDPNPGLSPAGRRRARALARVLGTVDMFSGVNAIFATEFRNSQETAEPIAKLLDLPVQIVEAENLRGLRDMIRFEHKGEMVLVVTDRNGMARLVSRLNGRRNLPPVADTEHDNIYIVSIPWYGKVETVGIKYGAPYVP
jgi:hypothetical protein